MGIITFFSEEHADNLTAKACELYNSGHLVKANIDRSDDKTIIELYMDSGDHHFFVLGDDIDFAVLAENGKTDNRCNIEIGV